MSEARYSVRAIDGDVTAWAQDFTTESVKFAGLTWDEAVELCRLAFKNGFTCLVWQQDGDADNGEEPE